MIDTRTDEIVDSIEVGATPHGLAMTPDGSEVLVAGFGTDRVMAIDTSTDQVTWRRRSVDRTTLPSRRGRRRVRGQPGGTAHNRRLS